MVDMNVVDPNAVLLFKASGWGFLGLFSFLLGMVMLAMSRMSYSDGLVLKLFERLQSCDQGEVKAEQNKE